MWLKGQAAECYPGIYHHVLLSDESIVDLQRGYRLVHSSNSHLKACFSDRFKMASQSVDSWNHEMILPRSHCCSDTNVYFHHA